MKSHKFVTGLGPLLLLLSVFDLYAKYKSGISFSLPANQSFLWLALLCVFISNSLRCHDKRISSLEEKVKKLSPQDLDI